MFPILWKLGTHVLSANKYNIVEQIFEILILTFLGNLF